MGGWLKADGARARPVAGQVPFCQGENDERLKREDNVLECSGELCLRCCHGIDFNSDSMVLSEVLSPSASGSQAEGDEFLVEQLNGVFGGF